jgi:hypothetical protein
MVGESSGITTLVYQEQVSRENQIQRDQDVSRETEDSNVSSSQGTADVASFSSAALELARTAVSSVEEAPQAEVDQQSQQSQPASSSGGGGSEPAQYLNITA